MYIIRLHVLSCINVHGACRIYNEPRVRIVRFRMRLARVLRRYAFVILAMYHCRFEKQVGIKLNAHCNGLAGMRNFNGAVRLTLMTGRCSTRILRC